MSSVAALGGLVAAASPSPSPSPYTPTEADLGSAPGLLTLLAFVLLVIAIVVIYRSMNRRIKKIDFEEPKPKDPTPPP